MIYTNYHSHTILCDGSHEPEVYVNKAYQSGLKAYGFSGHAPIPLKCDFCMKYEQMLNYIKQIGLLKEKWRNKIQLYSGLEIDFIPNIISPNSQFIRGLDLDYTIGSIHFIYFFRKKRLWPLDGSLEEFEQGLEEIYAGNIKKAAIKYYDILRRMIIEDKPTIVGHLDKFKMHNTGNRFFNEDAEWYQKLVLKTLRTIERSGAIVEINTRGYYTGKTGQLYPDGFILDQLKSLNIPVVINSDAHHPEEISSGFDYAVSRLLEYGIKSHMILIDGKWKKCKLESEK